MGQLRGLVLFVLEGGDGEGVATGLMACLFLVSCALCLSLCITSW